MSPFWIRRAATLKRRARIDEARRTTGQSANHPVTTLPRAWPRPHGGHSAPPRPERPGVPHLFLMSDYVYRNVSVRHFTCDVIARDGSFCVRTLSRCSQSIACAEHPHGGRRPGSSALLRTWSDFCHLSEGLRTRFSRGARRRDGAAVLRKGPAGPRAAPLARWFLPQWRSSTVARSSREDGQTFLPPRTVKEFQFRPLARRAGGRVFPIG
jgi:hypothetical protein